MFYSEYTIGGELYHAGNHKYLEKVKTKSGKWRYIYTRSNAGVQRAENVDQALINKKNKDKINLTKRVLNKNTLLKYKKENVRSIRPGFGMETKYIDDIIGREAKVDIEKGTPMSWDLIR